MKLSENESLPENTVFCTAGLYSSCALCKIKYWPFLSKVWM